MSSLALFRPSLRILALACLFIASNVKAAGANPFQVDTSGSARRKVALVIGNDKYTKQLKNAVNDATSVAEAASAGGFSVTLLTNSPLAEMGTEIDKFLSQIRKGDIALFYYSGHGFQIEGENFLVPVDFSGTNQVTARYGAYSASRVVDGLIARQSSLNIVILDACRDNPFKGTRGGQAGLAAMSTGAGTLIAFGTSPGSTASDNPAESHGLFTKALLANIGLPNLGIEQLFANVRTQVYRESLGQQVPWTASSIVDQAVLSEAASSPNAGPATNGSNRSATELMSANRSPIDVTGRRPLVLGVPVPLTTDVGFQLSPNIVRTPSSVPTINQGRDVSGQSTSVEGPSSDTLLATVQSGAAEMPMAPDVAMPPPAPIVQVRDNRVVLAASQKNSPLGDVDASQVGLSRAHEQIKQRDLTAAERTLAELLRADSQNAQVTLLLGRVYLLQRRYQDGINRFNYAMQLMPLNPLPLYLRSIAYALLGQYDLALKDCEAGLSAKESDVRFLLSKANILFVVGRFEESIATCNQIIASKPSLPSAYLIRGNCERALGNVSAAATDYARGAAIQSASP